MPELPEVETVRTGLQRFLPGKVVAGVTHNWEKSFPNAPEDVREYLIGAKILEIKRRAKVLIIELDTKYSLVIHLKMTGQLVYIRKANDTRAKSNEQRAEDEVRFGAGHPNGSLIGELPDKSTRVVFCLQERKGVALEPSARKHRSTEGDVHEVHRLSTGVADTAMGQERWRSFGLRPKAGQCDAHLFFNDQRKFGWVRLIPAAEVPNIDFFRKVGPEPLSAAFTAKDFRERLTRRKNSSIKAALIDQTVIAGVGNIYADESLWGAKIHPSTQIKNIGETKLNTLFAQLLSVLKLSIEKGGSTDRNYVNAEGKRGRYLSFANVFRREGQPCPRHPDTMITKIKVAGRGTHICPKCQKEQR